MNALSGKRTTASRIRTTLALLGLVAIVAIGGLSVAGADTGPVSQCTWHASNTGSGCWITFVGPRIQVSGADFKGSTFTIDVYRFTGATQELLATCSGVGACMGSGGGVPDGSRLLCLSRGSRMGQMSCSSWGRRI
jgi:hypothetical protein